MSKGVVNFLARFFRPRTEVRMIVRDVTRLRLAEWQMSPQCIKIAQKFLHDPEFRLLIDVLRNEHPQNQFFLNAAIEERAIQQAKCEGYMMCLNNIEAMATLPKVHAQLEPTYEPPEEDLEK